MKENNFEKSIQQIFKVKKIFLTLKKMIIMNDSLKMMMKKLVCKDRQRRRQTRLQKHQKVFAKVSVAAGEAYLPAKT